MSELQAKHGGPVDWPWTSPRTPAALLVGVPLVLLDINNAIQLMTVLNITSFVLIIYLSSTTAGISPRAAVRATPLLLASEPGRHVIMTSNMAPLIGLAIVATWIWAKQDVWWVGIPLGVATGMRIFPAVLIIALWFGGCRKVAVGGTVTATLLTIVAVAFPAVTIDGTLAVLGDSQLFLFHSANLSLPGVLVFHEIIPLAMGVALGVLLPLTIVWRLRAARVAWDRGLLFAAPAILLAGPVTWPAYLLGAGPSIADAFRRKWVAAALIILWYLPMATSLIVPVTISLLLVCLRLRETSFSVAERHHPTRRGSRPMARQTRDAITRIG